MSILLTNDNPLEFPDYFLGPVETISCSKSALASRRLSLHDITEAYHTLSMRIRRSSSTLTARTGSFPALEPLRQKGCRRGGSPAEGYLSGLARFRAAYI
jgi:hypothetical protein